MSTEFEDFLATNGIRHVTSAPYHPATNGLAERAVQIVKRNLKKTTEGSIKSRLAKMLYAYRLTPQSTTGVSPAEMLLGRRPRSRLDVLRPLTAERVESQQRLLQEGDPVLVRNYLQEEKWLPGTIEKKTGPVSCTVKLDDGRSRRCHQDQVRKRFKEIAPPEEEPDVDIPKQSPEVIVDPKTDELPEVEALPGSHEPKVTPAVDAKKIYPRRERKPVDRFEPKW